MKQDNHNNRPKCHARTRVPVCIYILPLLLMSTLNVSWLVNIKWIGAEVCTLSVYIKWHYRYSSSFHFLSYNLLPHENLESWWNSALFSTFKLHAAFMNFVCIGFCMFGVKLHLVTFAFCSRMLWLELFSMNSSPLLYCDVIIIFLCISYVFWSYKMSK